MTPLGPGGTYPYVAPPADLTLGQYLGRRVRELRLERGLTQTELALRMGYASGGIGHKRLSKIEHDGQNITLRTMQKLASALGVAPRALLP